MYIGTQIFLYIRPFTNDVRIKNGFFFFLGAYRGKICNPATIYIRSVMAFHK